MRMLELFVDTSTLFSIGEAGVFVPFFFLNRMYFMPSVHVMNSINTKCGSYGIGVRFLTDGVVPSLPCLV